MYVYPVSRWKDNACSGIKTGSVIYSYTPVSPGVPELEGMYTPGGIPFLIFFRVQVRPRGGRWAGLSWRVELSFAGPGEVKRRAVVLDPQESPGEIKSREAELGSESWTTLYFTCPSKAVLRTLCLWLLGTAVGTAVGLALARSPLLP